MKRRWRLIVVVAAAAALAVVGGATYRSSVEIDLESGMIRSVTTSMGITFYKSQPSKTTLSDALGNTRQPSRWLVIASEGFSFPRTRIDFCYPRMLFHAGFFERSFNNRRMARLVAEAALTELSESEDPCLVKDHLKSAWDELSECYDDSWSESMIDSEIARIWDESKPNKSRVATGDSVPR